MDRAARVALVAAAAAAAYGARAWSRRREDRDVWASATDALPEGADRAEPAPQA